jgi:hypothetical protein
MQPYWKRFWKQVWTDVWTWGKLQVWALAITTLGAVGQMASGLISSQSDFQRVLWGLAAYPVGAIVVLVVAVVRAPVKLDEKLRSDWHEERERMKAAQAKQVDALQDQITLRGEQIKVLRERPYGVQIEHKVKELLRQFPKDALPLLEFLLADEQPVKRERLNMPMPAGLIGDLIRFDDRWRGGVCDRFYYIPQDYREPLKDLLHPYPKP